MKVLFFYHLDQKGRPVGEEVIPLFPALTVDEHTFEGLLAGRDGSLPTRGPEARLLPVAGLLAEFLAVPSNTDGILAFLGRWWVESVYPWGEADARRVDNPSIAVRWDFEREALRDCVRRWLSPEGAPPVQRFAQDMWPPKVRDNAMARLARLSLEPATATRCSVRQFKRAYNRILSGEADDIPVRLEVFAWHYWTEDILALVWLDLFTCVQHGIILRICPLCENYFASNGSNAQYCPACRTPEGRAKRQRLARQQRPEKWKEWGRIWNRMRMKAVRRAQANDWQPAFELVLEALKDRWLRARVRGLRPDGETYRVLEQAGERLLNRQKINLDAFYQLFPPEE